MAFQLALGKQSKPKETLIKIAKEARIIKIAKEARTFYLSRKGLYNNLIRRDADLIISFETH